MAKRKEKDRRRCDDEGLQKRKKTTKPPPERTTSLSAGSFASGVRSSRVYGERSDSTNVRSVREPNAEKRDEKLRG